MKMSFYCLPLRKHVKAKVTAIVKKKSYSIKGVHKENGKDYNLNKVVGKAEAERISKETGIDIDEGQLAAAAEGFLPTGSGHVIGQNTAGMETAIEGTEETVTANTTPFRSEDDEDNIGPMRMEAEVDTSPDRLPGESTKEMMARRDTPEYKAARKKRGKAKRQDIQKTAPYLKVKGYKMDDTNKSYLLDVGLPTEVLLHLKDLKTSGMEIDEIDTIQVHSQKGGSFPMVIDSRFVEPYKAETVSVGDNCPTCKKEIEEVAICSSCDTRSCMPCRDSGDWSYDEKLVSNDNSGDICSSCITKNAEGYKKSRSSSDEEEVLEGAMEDELAEDVPEGFSPSDDKTVQFEDGTLMSPTKEAETGGVSYAIEPDHWLRLQAHRDWQGTREEVNVERENNFWVITGSQESADDILDLIIETADTELTDMTPVTSTGISKGVTLGIGVLGIAASIILLQRFNKSD